MRKTARILIPIAIILFLFGIILPQQNKNTVNAPPPPISTTNTPSPDISITPIAAENSKCHAVLLDAADPQSYLPDKNCTPGVIDPAVAQENLYQTICKAGYTQTVRPPASYTNKLKIQEIAEYGYINTDLKNYEEDHFISLELGGSPDDPKNLWPQPHPSYNEKDSVENYLHSQVCSGKMTLAEAQKEISTNWYEVYKQIQK